MAEKKHHRFFALDEMTGESIPVIPVIRKQEKSSKEAKLKSNCNHNWVAQGDHYECSKCGELCDLD